MAVDVSSEIVIDRPRESVARFAADPSNAPRWYANISSVRWHGDPVVAVGAQVDFGAHFLGRRLAYTYEIVSWTPDDRLVMRTAQGPFPMETTYTFRDAGAGRTHMTLRNRGEPAGFSRVAAPALAAAMRRANAKDLTAIKRILEA